MQYLVIIAGMQIMTINLSVQAYVSGTHTIKSFVLTIQVMQLK